MTFNDLARLNYDKLSYNEKIIYLNQIKEYIKNISDNKKNMSIIKNCLLQIFPLFRNFKIEIQGEENIPRNEKFIFLINHSNSHDFFIMQEMLKALNLEGCFLAASDSINGFTDNLFKMFNAVTIDRSNKEESFNGLCLLSKKIENGSKGIILGEGTWNLHPIKPMQNIKLGAVKTATFADALILPTIFEYVEVLDTCSKEKELYSKCIIRFGKPISINKENSLIFQNQTVQNTMIELRKSIWKEMNIVRNTLEDINQKIYLNHTYLKKFGGLGFSFDSDYELPFIYFNKDENKENEFHLSKTLKFEPGTIQKEDKNIYL